MVGMSDLKDNYFNSAFNVKKLLNMCQIYDDDKVTSIINMSFNDLSEDECYKDELIIEKLISMVSVCMDSNLSRNICIAKQVFTSKLTLIPIIFGMYNANKSSVSVDLSYYLNIPNIIHTKTIYETLVLSNIDEEFSPNFQCDDEIESPFKDNYFSKCKVISKSIFFEIEKSIKQGKSKIFCGYNLFIPYIFYMKNNKMFPKPEFLNDKEIKYSDINNNDKYFYYLHFKDEHKTSALFFPIILKINNLALNNNHSTFFKEQQYIIDKTINNKFGWPIKTVIHDPADHQYSSRMIHSHILDTLRMLYYSGKWLI